MEEKERQSTALEDLCPDLIAAVLRRIPLLHRTRLKLVSKAWRHHITALRRHPETTSFGLVILYRQVQNDPNLHQSHLLRIQDSSATSLSLSSSLSHSYPWLLDSCNGLVLYAKTNETHNWDYCVSSPVLNQYRILPRRRKSEILARESLAFDGSHMGNFKVVLIFFQDVDFLGGKIGCQIFSSETGDWREIEAPLINSYLIQIGFQLEDIWGHSVYRNRKLYWVWSICMLIFDEDEEIFELVNLPTSKETGERKEKRTRYFSCMGLWVSEGKIHYCEQSEEGFRVWQYRDSDYDDDDKWEARRLIALEKLKLRKIETINWFGEKVEFAIPKGHIWPCAFNEDLQLLFFRVGPGIVYSYSFETREFEEVRGCGNTGQEQTYLTSCVCPFFFNSVNLDI